MKSFFDSHAHLYMLEHAPIEEILKRAKQANVDKMITISTEEANWEKNYELSKQLDNVYFSLGVHPHDAVHWEDFEPKLFNYFTDNKPPKKCVAIGEIGLDYYYDNSPREKQLIALESQLTLAKRLDLPVVIHCREAFEDFFAVLKRVGPLPKAGVMHCFTGTTEEAKRSLDLGFKISFSGILSFKKAEALRQTAKIVPKDDLLIETDCPFLTPEPHRGKPNEPSYLPFTAEVLSSVIGEPVEEIARITTSNACSLFDIAE